LSFSFSKKNDFHQIFEVLGKQEHFFNWIKKKKLFFFQVGYLLQSLAQKKNLTMPVNYVNVLNIIIGKD